MTSSPGDNDELYQSTAPMIWRVVAAFGNHGIAMVDDPAAGEDPDAMLEIHFRRRAGRPLAGDRVVLDGDNSVAEILERSSVFGRGGPRGAFQPVAANLDTLLIVIAPEPAPSEDLLHRYLAAAWLQSVEPVLVINKRDLEIPDQPPFSDLSELGLETFATRGEDPVELDGLEERLREGIHLLAGQSGVGKSSLANALLPELSLETSALSRSTGKGRHTTTSTRLHRLPGGGWLVDTPGVWEYGLWAMEPAELERGFPEFERREGECRYRDCRHDHEPHCAVRDAVEAGRIPDCRYRAWLSLLSEQRRLRG